MGAKLIQLYDAPYGGGVELLPSLEPLRRMNRRAIFNRTWESVTIYREDGRTLRIHPKESERPKKNLWSVLVAFFYDPPVKVHFLYEESGNYELDEIKTKILEYVSEDDDILTQFLNGDQIQALFAQSIAFSDLVAAIEKMQGRAYIGA